MNRLTPLDDALIIEADLLISPEFALFLRNPALVGADIGDALVNTGASEIPAPCLADLNGDGDLNVQDILGFIQSYVSRDAEADFAEPKGEFDSRDILAFLDAFLRGCP